MNSWMRPLKSCNCTKLTLPCTRLSTMRPAIFTRRAAASTASAVCTSLSANSVCRSPAKLSTLKSFGNAMPCPRSALSFSRRSAINLFSSGRVSVTSLMDGSVAASARWTVDVSWMGRRSIALVENLLDAAFGGIPALARAVADGDACLLRAMADAGAGLFRAVPDLPGHMPGRVTDIAGAVGDAVADRLGILLDALPGAALRRLRCRAERHQRDQGDQENADLLAVHARHLVNGRVEGNRASGIDALGAGFEAGFQACLDELVEVAVEHLLGVRTLDAGAQILDAALVEHVVADLAAPADVGLGRFQRVPLGIALLHFQFVQLGGQHLHRAVAVGVLAALGLAGHDRVGGHVGDAHRRLGLVDVLAAGTRRTVYVGLQVGRVDVDLDAVVHFRRNEYRGETGVPAVVRIERALAHQPVHADLGLQPAVGIVALDAERGGLDAGHVAAADFHQLGFPATVLAPAQVHAQQHFGPVLRLGAAGAGLDVDERVHRVHLAGEHALELQLADLRLQLVQVVDHRLRGVVIAVGDGHLQQVAGVVQAGSQRVDAVDDGVQSGAFAAQFLRVGRVVPHGGALQFAGYFFQALALGGVVKDTP